MQPLDPVISRETHARLKAYEALLHKWQEKINLISSATLEDSWRRHFEDSAQLADFLPQNAHIMDWGSGAGFPGLVLAMIRPDLSVTLVESDAKKCAFLQTVSRETKTPVAIENARIEHVVSRRLAVFRENPTEILPDYISARALAALDALLNYAAPLLTVKPDMGFVFLKGAQASGEIKAARAAGWSFDLEAVPSVTAPDARVLRLTKVRQTGC